MSRCDAELCPYWTGQGCICDVLDLKGVMGSRWIISGKCEACWAENRSEGCDWAMCGCSCHDDGDPYEDDLDEAEDANAIRRNPAVDLAIDKANTARKWAQASTATATNRKG